MGCVNCKCGFDEMTGKWIHAQDRVNVLEREREASAAERGKPAPFCTCDEMPGDDAECTMHSPTRTAVVPDPVLWDGMALVPAKMVIELNEKLGVAYDDYNKLNARSLAAEQELATLRARPDSSVAQFLNNQILELRAQRAGLTETLVRYQQALQLIAAPKRADGTYNRCREACQDLAKAALMGPETTQHDYQKGDK